MFKFNALVTVAWLCSAGLTVQAADNTQHTNQNSDGYGNYLGEINSEVDNVKYFNRTQPSSAETPTNPDEKLSVNDMLKRLKNLVRNHEI